jgi:hypothetical protein
MPNRVWTNVTSGVGRHLGDFEFWRHLKDMYIVIDCTCVLSGSFNVLQTLVLQGMRH